MNRKNVRKGESEPLTPLDVYSSQKEDRSLSKQGMVDVGHKQATNRKAVATAKIRLGQKAFAALVRGDSPKGNIFETAKVAGIMAAKSTPRMIPMCHPLELSKANVIFEKNDKEHSLSVRSEVSYYGRTGVEMEALVAVTVAALTVYDMMKWADKAMEITEIRLLEKSGGKSGSYRRSRRRKRKNKDKVAT